MDSVKYSVVRSAPPKATLVSDAPARSCVDHFGLLWFRAQLKPSLDCDH